MNQRDDYTPNWKQPKKYFTGRLSMFVTYPIVTFLLGLALGYFVL